MPGPTIRGPLIFIGTTPSLNIERPDLQNPQRLASLQRLLKEAEEHPEKFSPEDVSDLLSKVIEGQKDLPFVDSNGTHTRFQSSPKLREQLSFLFPPSGPQAGSQGSSGGNGSQPIQLRDYQIYYIAETEKALGTSVAPNTPWDKTKPKDRGYIISPWQTGKSLLIGPVAEQAKQYLPGKKTLVVSPYKVITQQIIEDLTKGFSGKVSVFDANQKDTSGDIIVASAFTLGRMDGNRAKNLLQLDNREIGLVVLDEMPFVLTPTWQRILFYLGFVDEKGQIIHSAGRFALGLGASGERGDGRHVRTFFGDSMIAARGFNWFIDHGYLHDILGLEVPYGTSEADWEKIEEEEETIVVMRDTPENRQRVIDTYKRHLEGKKTLVYVERVEHANHLVEDFNKIFGEGYAAAITQGTPDKETNKILKQFNGGFGPKVLVSINKIGLGFRAIGADGVIHTAQTNSWNKFANRSSRILARQEGEPQRNVLIITMEGKGMPLDITQSAASLVGVYDKPILNEIYRPRALKKQIRGGGAHRWKKGPGGGLLRVGPEMVRQLRVRANVFGEAMQKVLHEKFDGDLVTMGEKTHLRLNDLDAYLHGFLPSTFDTVFQLAMKLDVDYDWLTKAWLADQMRLLDAAYPLPEDLGVAQRGLTQLVRLAFLRTSTTGGISAMSRKTSDNRRLYQAFRGQFPIMAESLRYFYDLIVKSDATDESTARSTIGAYVNEVAAKRKKVGPPYAKDTDEEFDHRHVDPLTTGRTVDIDSIPEEDLDDMLVASSPPSPFVSFNRQELSEKIRQVLASLTPRLEEIIKLRFGFKGEEKTLEEVGEEIVVTRGRVGQLEARALRGLRHPRRSKQLEAFVSSSVEDEDLPLLYERPLLVDKTPFPEKDYIYDAYKQIAILSQRVPSNQVDYFKFVLNWLRGQSKAVDYGYFYIKGKSSEDSPFASCPTNTFIPISGLWEILEKLLSAALKTTETPEASTMDLDNLTRDAQRFFELLQNAKVNRWRETLFFE